MATNSSINLDARWLRDFANLALSRHDIVDLDLAHPGWEARLLSIASNLDRFEEASHLANDYNRGVIEGERRVYARSNLVQPDSAPDFGAIASILAKDKPVTKVPKGKRTLDERGKPLDPSTGKPYVEAKPEKPSKYAHLHIDLTDITL